MEDIAVIGIACRFPGDATSPEKLWEVLARGESAWSEIPKERFNVNGFYHPDTKRQGCISLRGGHFLKDNIAAWDASFFGVHAEDAVATDPQHRILLEVSFEAVENAGLRKEDIDNSNTSVFVGCFVKDYEQISLYDPDFMPRYAATGGAHAILANRLSWFYNFKGTSQAIDTACSGSLVAVHQAVRCLQVHDSDMAMVGGAGMILTPETMIAMDSMNFLSKDGKCFTFDHRANGYGRGEGCGVVILKRLSDALRDNDTIRGVIRGARTNHDGRTAGISLPNGVAQADNIRALYEQASLDYHQTGYVECHGTGTPVGDPTELRALSETISKDRLPGTPLTVGSVKTNIGHLEGAAGVAGLIKTILCLEKACIPPTINFEKPNPKIDFDGWRVKVVHKMTDWPMEGPRRASVNSFGFGGTNAHVVIDEASAYLAERSLQGNHNSVGYKSNQGPRPPSSALTTCVGYEGTKGSSQAPPASEPPTDCLRRTNSAANLSEPLESGRFPKPGSITYLNNFPYLPLSSPIPLSQGSASSPCPSITSVESLGYSASATGDLDSLTISEAAPAKDEAQRSNTSKSVDSSQDGGGADGRLTGGQVQLFVFSATDRRGVARMIDSYVKFIQAKGDGELKFADFLYTLNSRRSCLNWRSYVLVDSLSSFVEKYRSCNITTIPLTRATTKATKVCFAFAGQGSVWAEMGADLNCFVAFKDSIAAADQYLVRHLGSPFSLSEEISKEKSASRISSPDIAQPATTALQVALVDLFESFGITPAFVVGHSSGEIAAAYAAKAITREQAWMIAYWRGFYATRVMAKDRSAVFRMLVVGLSATEAQKHIDTSKRPLEIACISSPSLVTISGPKEDIEFLREMFQSTDCAKIFCKMLDIPLAYHSRQMILIQDDYKMALGSITPAVIANSPKMYSSVTGKLVSKSELGASYWATNLANQVKFSEAVNTLAAGENPDLYLEISPSNSLESCILPSVGGTYPYSATPGYLSALSMTQPGIEWTLRTIGECWLRGLSIQFDKVISRTGCKALDGPYKHLVDLPTYPWNHERKFWHKSHLIREYYNRPGGRRDLVGIRTQDSTNFSANYRHLLRLSENPWIQDHQVQRTILYPAAGIMAMMIEGVFLEIGEKGDILAGFLVEGFHISKPLVVPSDNHGLRVQLNIRPESQLKNPGFSFAAQVYSKLASTATDWVFNASAVVRPKLAEGNWKNCLDLDLAIYGPAYTKAKQRCGFDVKPCQMYEEMDVVGMNYGPLFRNVEEIQTPNDPDDHSECVSVVKVPDTRSLMPENFEFEHFIHPATLDSMFHMLFALKNDAMVPIGIDKVWIEGSLRGQAGDQFDGYASAHLEPDQKCSKATVVMNKRGRSWDMPSVVFEGARFAKLALSSPRAGGFIPSHRNLTSHMAWKEDVVLSPKHDHICSFLYLLCHKFPDMSVLQVGGDGALAIQLLEILSEHDYHNAPNFMRFSISEDQGGEIHQQLTTEYGDKAPLLKYIEQRVFDPNARGPTYNLIVVGTNTSVQMKDLRKFLRPDGFIVDFTDMSSIDDPNLGDKMDEFRPPVVATQGLQPTANSKPTNAYLLRAQQLVDYEAAPETSILVPSEPSPRLVDAITNLQGRFTKRNIKFRTISWAELAENMETCDKSIGATLWIFLWEASDPNLKSPYQWNEIDFNIFKWLVATAKGLVCVTLIDQGNEINSNANFHAMFTGLLRTIRSEDSSKLIVQVILAGLGTTGCHYSTPEERVSDLVMTVFERTFLVSRIFGPVECEYSDVETPGRLSVPRLVPYHHLNQLIDGGQESRLKRLQGENTGAYHLHQAEPGFEDIHRQWIEKSDKPIHLHDNAVQIRVKSTILGENDLHVAEGNDWPLQLGIDILGEVVRVGPLVTSIKAGDSVIALVNGGLCNRVMVHEKLVCLVPSKAKLNEMPILSRYLAAHYWFARVLEKSRISNTKTKVLVKKGSCSWGQAAIRVAKARGSHVTAVVHQEQVRIAKQCGADTIVLRIRDALEGEEFDGIFDPEDAISKDLAQRIARDADGHQGEPVPELVALFAQACKAISQTTDLQNYSHDVISHCVKTESIGSILKDIQGSRYAYASTHVLNLNADTIINVKASREISPVDDAINLGGIYVLVGAFGGLGEDIARVLVNGGARNLVFLSRTGESQSSANGCADDLRSGGVKVRSFAVDIGDLAVLKQVWRDITKSGRIAGVVQCAAVLKDSIFENLSFEDWQAVIRPKTIGTHNLLTAALADKAVDATTPLPWFMFLSSATGIIGNRGQAAYAAGNTYLDAMASHLCRHDIPAASLAFGPVLGAGILSRDESTMNHLRASGFFGIRQRDFRLVITRTIRSLALKTARKIPTLLVIGVGSGGIIRQNKPADPYWARHAHYRRLNMIDIPYPDLGNVSEISSGGAQHQQADMANKLSRCETVAEMKDLILEGIVTLLAKTLSTLKENIDVQRSAATYGVDSLLAGTVINWILANIGVRVSIFEVTADVSIEALAMEVAGRVMRKMDEDGKEIATEERGEE